MRKSEFLNNFQQLVSWYTDANPQRGVSQAWQTQWQIREPRHIPADRDGGINLGIFIIEKWLYEQRLGERRTVPNSMLEIGSGPGSRGMQIAKAVQAKALYLLDSDDGALRHHAVPLSEQCGMGEITTHVQGNMLSLPFPDDSVDVVYAYGPHDHFFGPERQVTFNEMQRITSKGGISIVILPSQLNPFWTAEMLIKVLSGTWPHGPTKFFTPHELMGRMQKAGFPMVELYGADFFTSWLRVLSRENQLKRFDTPTGNSKIDNWLLDKNLDFTSKLNIILGGSMMTVGYK